MEYRRSESTYIESAGQDIDGKKEINNSYNPINELIHILDTKVFRVVLILTLIMLFYFYH